MTEKNITRWVFKTAIISVIMTASPFSPALTLEELAEKVNALEAENRELRAELDQIQAARGAREGVRPGSSQKDIDNPVSNAGYINYNHAYSYHLLDATTDINRKQLFILDQLKYGNLGNSVILGGAVTAISDFQHSDTDSKFGYLMRHPTSNNQIGKNVSEAVLHSIQLDVTANMNDWIRACVEILYDPEQSFGAGTITDLNRNQLQLRRGYVLLGGVGDEFPFYLSLGKMATPFGLTDTVSPFTASTIWHAFGGLAYGVQTGYHKDGLSIRLMGVQGGSQFRAANTSVGGTNVPSKLNNYIVDANYTFDINDYPGRLMLGGSYERGSAYCQEFPVTHFSSCPDDNPAYDVYARLDWGALQINAEFAKTLDEWPGTFNPDIPQYGAEKVTTFSVGSKYGFELFGKPLYLSTEFSRFKAGPDGSPWERQDQAVLGIANFITPSVKMFGEYIHVKGYVPLNFLSGGNLEPGESHSVNGAESDVILMGVTTAF